MQKRGQVIIFILLSMTILIAIGLMLYILKNVGTEKTEVTKATTLLSNVLPLKSYFESCLRSLSADGIHFVSSQGGYYNVFNPKLKFSSLSIPHYVYHNKIIFPSQERIQSEISDFIEDHAILCTNNSFIYSTFGYNISIETASAETSITKEKIVVKISYPISIFVGKQEQLIEEFIIIIDFNLKKKYDVISQFMEEQSKTIDSIPISFLTELGYYNEFIYNLFDVNSNTVLYNIIFNDTSLNNKKFIYNFVAEYNWTIGNKIQNINIDSIPEQNAYTGYYYSYKINATGEDLTFYDYSGLFDIDPKEGTIEFMPEVADKGSYDIIIEARDKFDNSDIEIFRLNVIHDNNEPIIDPIENIDITFNEVLNITVSAYDEDNDPILYSVESSLPNIIIHPETGQLLLKPTMSQVGTYTITIFAIDSQLGIDRKSFTLRIKDE